MNRRRVAVAGSTAAALHLVLITVLMLYDPAPRRADSGMRPAPVIPFYFTPRRSDADNPDRPTVNRRDPPARPDRTAEQTGPSTPLAESAAASPPELDDGVRRTLRARLGCSLGSDVVLSEAERAACDERMGSDAAAAVALSGIPPDKRAYYDAMLASRHGPGRGPAIVCAPRDRKGKGPPHSLKLGPLPCYVLPPVGPLTPGADVAEPD